MRNLTIVVVIFVIGVVVGSVYVHRDTRLFVESLEKNFSNETLDSEDSRPHGEGSHQHGKDLNAQPKSQSGKVSKPAWWDDAEQELDSPDPVNTVDLWAKPLTQALETEDDDERKGESLVEVSGRKLDPNDPYDLYEIMLAASLNEHGDIPEVHIVAEGWLKVNLGQKQTPEEKLTLMEAMNYLNPHPSTQRSIEMQKLIIVGDFDTLIEKYGESGPESDQPFYDVAHFFDGENHAEGFRQLRAADPKRASEFEEFIRKEAHSPSSGINPEDIERAIQRSYDPPQEN